MSESEFQVAGKDYRAKRLNAFDAYDVARKWAYVFLMMARAENLTPKTFAQGFVTFTGPTPKSDNDFAMDICLNSVTRKLENGTGYAPVKVNGQIRFEDIGLQEMLEVVYHVILQNRLVDFFVESPATQTQATAGETGAQN